MTFKSTFFCVILFIDVSCRYRNIFLNKHNMSNTYYYARNSCPLTCMQPCYLDLFSTVEEEEKCESHDTREVTSSDPFQSPWVDDRFVLSSIFHIFITLSASFECPNLTHAALLRIFPE